jgi:hypothetical protein
MTRHRIIIEASISDTNPFKEATYCIAREGLPYL